MSEYSIPKWEVTEDAYYKESRYVEYPSGKILGYVRGCNHDSNAVWNASITEFNKPHVGAYVTEGLAKKAVEQARAAIAQAKEQG